MTVRLTAKLDRERIWCKGNSVRYLVVEVEDTGKVDRGTPAALNLALVVDASGSMAGEPLEFAVDAAQRVVSCLNENDQLSVVSFDDKVADHVVSMPMTREGQQQAKLALQRLAPGGSTNLCGGWLRGAEHVAQLMESGRAFHNRAIVLSDGHANQGVIDPAQLAEHARQLAVRGLFTSTIGVGDHYCSETLEAMAVNGGGVHHRAARPHEIVEVVSAELQGIRETAVEGVTVTIRHGSDVRVRSLNEFPAHAGSGESVFSLGSLASGASRTAVFSLKFPKGVRLH